jgi:hypothetical protein
MRSFGLVDVDLGGGLAGLGAALGLEEFLEQRLEEAGGDDLDVVDGHLGGLGERLALGVVERVGHQHRDRSWARSSCRGRCLAADDGVAVTSTSLSSMSMSSILVTRGSSVSLEMNLAVSSAVSWNFGSSMRWMRVEEYSATS